MKSLESNNICVTLFAETNLREGYSVKVESSFRRQGPYDIEAQCILEMKDYF